MQTGSLNGLPSVFRMTDLTLFPTNNDSASTCLFGTDCQTRELFLPDGREHAVLNGLHGMNEMHNTLGIWFVRPQVTNAMFMR